MKLPTPAEAKKLGTGEGLIEFLTKAVQDERESCAALADAMAVRRPDAAEVLQIVAAQIRARS